MLLCLESVRWCVLVSVQLKHRRNERNRHPLHPLQGFVQFKALNFTIDLTAEEEYASFPLTQLSEREPSTYELNEKESIAYERDVPFSCMGSPGNTCQGPNQSGIVSRSITICSGHV